MSDAIKKPAHYNQGPIECIDAMRIVLTPEEFRGYLKGNVFKYLWREKGKNGIEDLRKGKDYYDRLIELLDASDPEQPKASLNSDKIPEGYRKLNDSSEEPRQIGDLRWSVAEKRYIEIGVDEIGYANRDNWAACRKIEPAIKQSLTTEPPDGWRWLEVGEVIRKGDLPFKDGLIYATEPIMLGMALQEHWKPMIRRNKFEVGEKVVEFVNNRIGVVKDIEAIGSGKASLYHVEMQDTKGMILFSPHQLAPYIEEQS